jgi:hypothetical protein
VVRSGADDDEEDAVAAVEEEDVGKGTPRWLLPDVGGT